MGGLCLPASARAPLARVMIGFPVGGSTDIVARLLAEVLRGRVADSVVVDSRPGGGGTIAADVVRKAPADGSVLLLSPSTAFTLQPYTHPRLPYDPATDFVAVAGLALYGGAIAVGPQVPASITTLQQFAAWARDNPGTIGYGSPGAGGGSHFVGFQLFGRMGLDITHVPYRGNQPAVVDLLGGQIAILVTGIPEVLAHAQQGRLRVLAVTLPSRSKLLPGVPTLQEAGFAGITGGLDVMGVHLPARTPAPLVAEIGELARSMVQSAAFVEACERMAYEPRYLEAGEFRGWLARERGAWAGVVQSSGFKP